MPLYPVIEPFSQGMLGVRDGQQVYWEVSGNPAGKPAVLIHGGPGYPAAGPRLWFDPSAYLVVRFDLRGCGQRTPYVSDVSTDQPPTPRTT